MLNYMNGCLFICITMCVYVHSGINNIIIQ